MNDQEFDKILGQIVDEHNSPPAVPRERMWRQVQAHRLQPARRPMRRLMQAAMAMAAVLVIGIGIGRWTSVPHETGPASEVTLQRDTPLSGLYAQATLALFDQADVMLTDFRLTGCAAKELEPSSQWASQMLVQTRLLQGTPVGENPELETLLMDLELVLAQIVAINPKTCDRDVAWIRSGLTERATLHRLRAVTDRPDVLDLI
jgi:hypothetical protein